MRMIMLKPDGSFEARIDHDARFAVMRDENGHAFHISLHTSMDTDVGPHFEQFYPEIAEWMSEHGIRITVLSQPPPLESFWAVPDRHELRVVAKTKRQLDAFNARWASLLNRSLFIFKMRSLTAPKLAALNVPHAGDDSTKEHVALFAPYAFHLEETNLTALKTQCVEWAKETILRRPFLLVYDKTTEKPLLRFRDEADLVLARLAGIAVRSR